MSRNTVIGTPYAREALNVFAATLRNIETGSFQKLLAECLAYAPSLQGADLQKTNLQGANLGERAGKPSICQVQIFFCADLKLASLMPEIYRKRLPAQVWS